MSFVAVFTAALFVQSIASAQSPASSSTELECFAKLQPLSSDMSFQLGKDDFLFDNGSNIWRVSANGFEACSENKDKKRFETDVTYLRIKTGDSESTIAYTSIDTVERSMRHERNPGLHPGFRSLSKIEKSFLKISQVTALECKPASDQAAAKAQVEKDLVARIRKADMLLRLKNLAASLPLVKDPDFAAYASAAEACTKAPGETATQARQLESTVNQLRPAANKPGRTTR